MKGYELVLYSNAALFLLFSLLSITYGILLTRGSACVEGETCERQADLGQRAIQVAPVFAVVGLGLATLGLFFTRRRRRSESDRAANSL